MLKRNFSIYANLLVTLLMGVSLFSCAVRRGTVHTVRKGETVWAISQEYGVSLDALIRVNRIDNVRNVKPGTKLVIPGAATQRRINKRNQGSTGEPESRSENFTKTDDTDRSYESSTTAAIKPGDIKPPPNSDKLRTAQDSFDPVWPCKGRLASRFEKGGGPTKRGIRIHVPAGTVVRAAEDGIVKLAGEVEKLSKLGQIVIIYHSNDIATIYAHLKSINVSKGDKVSKAQKIGEVGTPGTVEQPSCYFEVRYKLEPRDPLIFLGEPA